MKKTIQWAVAMVLLLVSTWAAAVVPVSSGLVSTTPVPINTSASPQYDPHVDGDLVSYSSLDDGGLYQTIHYYRFSSGVDQTISNTVAPPGWMGWFAQHGAGSCGGGPNCLWLSVQDLGGRFHSQDYLSDVQGERIVFDGFTSDAGINSQIYDVATGARVEINPMRHDIPPSTWHLRSGIAIGGNTVAFADSGHTGQGVLFVWDALTQTTTQLTNDTRDNDWPKVSPSGNTIVWESCDAPAYSFSNCDIMMAQRTGSGWSVTPVANSALNELEADTNGAYTVWTASAGDVNGSDIYWVAAGSATPQRLELPGDQTQPHIAGGVISFLSTDSVTRHSDLYLYEIASNRLYQLTNTPTVYEGLNDIAVLSTGELRMVWEANDGAGNIYGTTLLLNQPPVANAGADQNIYLGETATLSGALSTDANGDPLTYAWSLDAAPLNSTATLADATTMTPSLTPDKLGAYHLSLVVNDGKADSAASPVMINVSQNLPPVAIASGTPTSGYAPLLVAFDASTSTDPEGSALSYSWNFGDGSALSALANPAHSYAAAGNYTAVVTVTDNFAKTDQASVAITVTAPNLPPVVLPTATPNHGASLLDVQFAANATDANPADVLSYSWNFGDGSALATVANPQHTYSAGTYTATVTVADGVNPAVSASLTISVSSALVIHVTEAKVEHGEKGKVNGRISMRANFDFAGVDIAWMPAPTDIIRVKFDGVTLLEIPFANFKAEGSPSAGKYEYETKTVEAELDFKRGTIKVSRHKMLTGGIDNANGIDVEISFGSATGTDHVAMTGEKGKRDSDLSHKE